MDKKFTSQTPIIFACFYGGGGPREGHCYKIINLNKKWLSYGPKKIIDNISKRTHWKISKFIVVTKSMYTKSLKVTRHLGHFFIYLTTASRFVCVR